MATRDQDRTVYAWRVYYAPDGVDVSYVGTYATLEEAEVAASLGGEGLPRSEWDTAIAAGGVWDDHAPAQDDVPWAEEDPDPVEWEGPDAWHAICAVRYRRPTREVAERCRRDGYDAEEALRGMLRAALAYAESWEIESAIVGVLDAMAQAGYPVRRLAEAFAACRGEWSDYGWVEPWEVWSEWVRSEDHAAPGDAWEWPIDLDMFSDLATEAWYRLRVQSVPDAIAAMRGRMDDDDLLVVAREVLDWDDWEAERADDATLDAMASLGDLHAMAEGKRRHC